MFLVTLLETAGILLLPELQTKALWKKAMRLFHGLPKR
jgi:hypothetical protein